MAENSGSTLRGLSKRAAQRGATTESFDKWLQFPDRRGRHLTVRRIGFQKYELLERGQIVAIMRGRWSGRWSPTSIEVCGKHYVVRRSRLDNLSGPFWLAPFGLLGSPPVEVYDRATGLQILEMVGRHWDWAERATVELMMDQGTLRFPVRGTNQGNAIMSCVNDSGAVLLEMRFAAVNWWRWFQEVEILITSRGPVGADVAIVTAIASVNMKTYFRRPTTSA